MPASRSFRLLVAAGAIALVACQRATPRSDASNPHRAEVIRTLTHDTDLPAGASGSLDLEALGRAAQATP
ncbi:MAG: hypothetical protein VKP72_05390 [bacterium]|nr:hypothetical protein [bacterium]